MSHTELAATIKAIAQTGKGILAADESTPTITKRFEAIHVESTENNRRDYRTMLFSTPELGNYVSGVILFEETLKQSTADGVTIPQLLKQQNIIPGIKVDKGLIPLVGHDNEKVTQGLDGLPERLDEYKGLGARFAKWRAVFTISESLPSMVTIRTNAHNLARYAAICQSKGIVPIVEPEILMDGDHSLERCQVVTERVLRAVFSALAEHKVALEYIILKPSMVTAGTKANVQADVKTVAQATLDTLKRCVPAAVPTINFLSGGQSAELATEHLRAMNEIEPHLPWHLSFSYGRALQQPSLQTWQGNSDKTAAAQAILLERAKLNSAASQGR
ncbi:MAG: class I fructose-bisphosphate aldolase [Gammaproteobacteria bacterium]